MKSNINSRLKIIIAVHHFPPTFKGGAEWRAHRTAKWLQGQGHRVKVICVESITDSATPDLRWVDETYDSLPVRRLYLNLSNSPNPARWEYDNPWIGAHLIHYLAEEKPDLFHLISGYLMTAAAIRAAKKLNIPVVLTLTDFWFLCQRHTLRRSSGQLCRQNSSLDCVRCAAEAKRRFRLPAQKIPALTDKLWQWSPSLPPVAEQVAEIDDRVQTLQTVLGEVDLAICPSNFLRQTYHNRGFQAKRMQFLRQGLVHLPPSPVKNSDSATLRLGYIGQIAPHKGVHVLIKAFLKVILNSGSDSKAGWPQLKLYGDVGQFPGYYRNLQQMIAQTLQRSNVGREDQQRAKEQIQFLGTFDNQQISQIYKNLDLLVMPSIWYENSPNVILEAFAHQTPVLASNLGGMAELVTDQQDGLLFAPNNADDLAKKLKTVLKNPLILSRLKNGILPPTTLESEMTALMQLYQSVLPTKEIVENYVHR